MILWIFYQQQNNLQYRLNAETETNSVSYDNLVTKTHRPNGEFSQRKEAVPKVLVITLGTPLSFIMNLILSNFIGAGRRSLQEDA